VDKPYIPYTYPNTGYADAAKTGANFEAVLNYLGQGGTDGLVAVGSQYQIAYYAEDGSRLSALPLITSNRALVSNSSGLPAASSVTATELGHLSGVTSALQTQINNKQNKYVFNVKDYGAVGNGIADDTASVISAIAAVTAVGGGTIFFPEGSYLVTSVIYVTESNIRFQGTGTTSIIKSTSLDDIFYVEGNNLTGITFEKLTFQGNFEDESILSKFAINVLPTSSASNILVQDCLFSGIDATHRLISGIKFNAVSDSAIVNCMFENIMGVVSSSGYGVLLGACTNVRVINTLHLAAPGFGRHAIYISSGCVRCLVAHNRVHNMNRSHIQLQSFGSQPTNAYNIISDNICSGGANTGSGDGHYSCYGLASGNKWINNISTSSGNYGIIINAAGSGSAYLTEFNEIIGNSVYFAGTVGINLAGTKDTILVGNTVYESSYGSAGTHANIQLIEDDTHGEKVERILVDGNSSSGSSYARSPFRINDAQPATGVILGSNYFPNGTSSGIMNTTGNTITLTPTVTTTGNPAAFAVTLAEFNYLGGVTSALQTQLNAKAASSHSHAISDVTSLQTGLDGKAATALSNLASVAINTSLVSDTNNTDDLGSPSIGWRTGYFRTSLGIGVTSTPLASFDNATASVFMDTVDSLPTDKDSYAGIIRTGAGGSAPFNQAGSLIFRPRVSSTSGRSSFYFYNSSPSTLKLKIDESGHVTPGGAGTQNFGDATNYWLDISYKTLTDRGCLPWCDTGVELRDGKVVSDLESICLISKHPTETTIQGLPKLDYRTFPKQAFKPADKDGVLLPRDKNDSPIGGVDGVEMTMMFGVFIGAFKEIKKENDLLKERIQLLEDKASEKRKDI
jgi:hypothetical protein